MTVCISPRLSILSQPFYFWLQPILRRASLFWFLFAFFIVCLSYWGLSCSQITIVWLIFISVLSCDWQRWSGCHMFILLYTVIHTSVACFILLFSFKYCLACFWKALLLESQHLWQQARRAGSRQYYSNILRMSYWLRTTPQK